MCKRNLEWSNLCSKDSRCIKTDVMRFLVKVVRFFWHSSASNYNKLLKVKHVESKALFKESSRSLCVLLCIFLWYKKRVTPGLFANI